MLGLRRSSVTVAAQTLQSRRFIKYRRGQIEIVNRNELKAARANATKSSAGHSIKF
jgi:hypothetical protein